MSGRLEGKVAIISGAARGQGEAEARLFVAEGARVVLGDVLVDEVRAVAHSLGEDRALASALDVTSEADWAAAVAAAETWGGVDICINNAAIHWTRRLEEETVADLRRMLDVNLVGTFLGMQAVFEPMRRKGGGSIVNVSSVAGLTGLERHAAYGSSKWAIRGLTRTGAVEWGEHGIRVNSVHPGPVRTAMLPSSGDAAADQERFASLPLGRAAEPIEVAQLVCHLASDESSFQTGGEYVVDGGGQAGRRRSSP